MHDKDTPEASHEVIEFTPEASHEVIKWAVRFRLTPVPHTSFEAIKSRDTGQFVCLITMILSDNNDIHCQAHN